MTKADETAAIMAQERKSWAVPDERSETASRRVSEVATAEHETASGQVGGSANGASSRSGTTPAQGGTRKSVAMRAYFARMTPEERKAEFRRRRKLAAETKRRIRAERDGASSRIGGTTPAQGGMSETATRRSTVNEPACEPDVRVVSRDALRLLQADLLIQLQLIGQLLEKLGDSVESLAENKEEGV